MNEMITFGDVRRMILDTIIELRAGKIATDRGMAIAANMKVLNDNLQVEINAAKMSLLTDGRAHTFGQVVQMGQRLLTDVSRPKPDDDSATIA